MNWSDPKIINDARIDDDDPRVRAAAQSLHNNESYHLHQDIQDQVCIYCALRASRVVSILDGKGEKRVSRQLDDGGKGGQTLSIDLDGVLHKYSRGWADGTIYDQPMEGAAWAMQQLLDRGFKLVVSTCREGVEEIRLWIQRNLGVDIEVTNAKPIASAYIDDRAIRFESWVQVLADLDRLLPVDKT